MAEFGKARYNVDVLKVEVPIVMEFVEGTKAFKGEKAYTRAEALQHFRDAEPTHKPFIYLSAGVSNPVFIETLELAGESGQAFNGVLCGRATWKDGIAIYAKQGADAFRDWLETTGVENIQNVNKALYCVSASPTSSGSRPRRSTPPCTARFRSTTARWAGRARLPTRSMRSWMVC
jgi:tagatose 1,6-diphosphate aldolase